MALAFNLAIVMSLVFYLVCKRKPDGSSCCSNLCPGSGAEPRREYQHLVSAEKKSNNLVVNFYTDKVALTSDRQGDDDLNLEWEPSSIINLFLFSNQFDQLFPCFLMTMNNLCQYRDWCVNVSIEMDPFVNRANHMYYITSFFLKFPLKWLGDLKHKNIPDNTKKIKGLFFLFEPPRCIINSWIN